MAEKNQIPTRMPQRTSVSDFDIADLPATFERFTLLDEYARYKMLPRISGAATQLREAIEELEATGSRSEDFARACECGRHWARHSVSELQELFMSLVKKTAPRVDQYGIERTIGQIVRCGAFLAYDARIRFELHRSAFTDHQLDDLTKRIQRELDYVLCLWINDFQEWAEPFRIDDSRRRPPTVVLHGKGRKPTVRGLEKKPLTQARYDIIVALLEAGERGLTKNELDKRSGRSEARKTLKLLAESDPDWKSVIMMAVSTGKRYRLLFD